MKKQLIGITVLALCLVVGFLILSCGPAPQNTSQNQNSNQNLSLVQKSSDAAATEDLPSDPDICKISNIGDRITVLKKKIKFKMERDKGKLLDQFQGVEIQGKKYPPSFTYDFYPYPNATAPKYVYLVIAGTVHERKPFQDLAEYAEDFVQKGCADQVFWVARLPRAGEELNILDLGPFEWSGCEYPLMMCTNGECQNPCARKFGVDAEPNTSGIAKAISNSRSNSNTNTNSNSNANKGVNK